MHKNVWWGQKAELHLWLSGLQTGLVCGGACCAEATVRGEWARALPVPEKSVQKGSQLSIYKLKAQSK